MSPQNVEERLQALREQALRREVQQDAWPRLQRRLRREPWRRAALVAGLVLAVLVVSVAPGLLARRTQPRPVPTVGTPVVPGRPVLAAQIRLDRPFSDVDVGFGATWVAGQGALLRIDPRSNRVVATIPTPLTGTDENASIAFGEGAVWVTSGQANGVVYRIDPATNRVTATIEVPGGAVRIVVAAGIVWVTQHRANPDPDTVTRIDARSNRLLSPVVEAPHMSGSICYGLDAIWVTDSRSTVSRIDPRSGAVTQRLHRVGIVQAVGGGSLWGTFYDNTGGVVQRIDPGTGRVLATIRIPYGWGMAFGLGTLWVAAHDTPPTTPGRNEPAKMKPGKLYRIDPANNQVLGRPVPLPGIAPTALAVGEGAVWVGELDSKTLTRFNLTP
jgi:virginiamycin B lyase